MNLTEYSRAQRVLIRRLTTLILALFKPYQRPEIGPRQWDNLVRTAFPAVDEARRQASDLARQFYDTARAEHFPDEPRHPIDLEPFFLEWFESDLEPVKAKLTIPDADDSALTELTGVVNEEVEAAGRRTVMRATQTDSKALGWARYDPKEPTCAFCTMLISRGPVYSEDTGQFPSHNHCTCKAVPVFDRENWPGRDQYVKADALWRSATRGKKGKEAVKAFRRALYSEESADDEATLPTV